MIKGTCVLVSNILGTLSAEESYEEIIENYPSISEYDIRAALGFASKLSQFCSLPNNTV